MLFKNRTLSRVALRLSTLLSLCAAAPAGTIRWQGGSVTLPPKTTPEKIAFLEAAAKSGPTGAAIGAPTGSAAAASSSASAAPHLVVQFTAPMQPALREQLAAAGLNLLAYLGDNAFFAAVDPGSLNAPAVAAVRSLESVEPINANWKLHPKFLRHEKPEWAVVDNSNPDDPIIGAYVLLHPDVAYDQIGIPLVIQNGGVVRDELWTINALVVELPLSSVYTLADDDAVQWIEPPLPQFAELNDSNRALTQANAVQAAPYGLTGTGVNVLVYDGGTALAMHQDFGGRVTVRDNSGTIAHATHVCGTIGGSGVASGGTFKGMAPGVTIQSYGFQYDGSGIFLYTNPGDLQNDYNEAINTFGAQIASNSIGTNTETNGFPCEIQGDYGVTDALIDSIVRGSLGAPFRVVWADGNERQGTRCNVEGFGSYYSTAPPATAKNHLTVGAVNSNDDSMTSFSSWGPTDDGRMKPDICAPGCQSNGDGGVTSCSSSSVTAYATMCGTSMATPTVTGLSSLLLEDFRAQFPGQPDFRNSTLRILFAHTAVDRGNVGPDYQFGYGSVRIKDAIDFMRLGHFTEVAVQNRRKFAVTVNPGTPQLKITMAWDDPPGTPNVVPSLINDLDLEVFDPSGNQAFPWTLNPQSPTSPAVKTAANHRDNIEQVLVNSPVAGTWRVEIKGYNVPQGPQTVSICSGEALIPQPNVEILFFDSAPATIAPGVATNLTMQVTPTLDTVVDGSPTLHVRYNAGPFLTIPLVSTGEGLYQAVLPPPVCGATPQYYFTASGAASGPTASPENAPASYYTAAVGGTATIVNDDCETDPGWTVGAPGDTATDGIWERVDPQATTAQPGDDHSPNGVACWVTNGIAGANANANDVDGGATTLTSPAYNLAAYPEAHLSYWRWYVNSTGGFTTEMFRVQISGNNGGSFSDVETLNGAFANGAWINHQLRIADILPTTSQMRLRFIASDLGGDSLVEAAIDDISITAFGCFETLADCNNNGILDSDDIASHRSHDVNANGIPDECEALCDPCDTNCDGSHNQFDIQPFVEQLSASHPTPCSPCAADTNGDGSRNQFDIQAFVECLAP